MLPDKPIDVDRCVVELAQLRRQMADVGFLCDRLYSQDHSRFDGSSYRYKIRVAKPKSAARVIQSLICELTTANQQWLKQTGNFDRLIARLPDEILTRVTLAPDTAAEDSVRECLKRARPALQYSLWALMPFAESFQSINRLIRHLGPPAPVASYQESLALLTSYHHHGSLKTRRRSPEIWDIAKGHYVFDSRGVQFAIQLTHALAEQSVLCKGTRYMDIGSGLATMPLAVAIASPASATGIEIHPGLAGQANSILHRLSRKCSGLRERVELIQGDFRTCAAKQISQQDIIYVYSPLGTQEIDLDQIVPHMKSGALLVSERIPNETLNLIRFEPRIVDLFALRRR